MRILFIAPQPFYEDRGTPIAVHDTLVAMSELGFEVDLATFPMGSQVFSKNVRIFRTMNLTGSRNVPVGFSFQKVLLDICLLLTVVRLANRNQYDCVHGVEEGAAIALLCKAWFGIPAIYDMQSSMPEQLRKVPWFRSGPGRWLGKFFERWLIKNADCIVASKGLASHVFSIQPGKKVLECAFNGFGPRPRNENLARSIGTINRTTVVYTGNFAPYQGLDLLLKAAHLVRAARPDVMFLLVGGTDDEIAGLAKWIRKHNLEHTIKLYQRRSRQEIPDFIALADILVLPRLRGNNAPLKIYDYLKSGKPIVATEIPAHKTLLSDETAILVEPDPAAFSNGILQAIRDSAHASGNTSQNKTVILSQALEPLSKTIAIAYGLVAAKRLQGNCSLR